MVQTSLFPLLLSIQGVPGEAGPGGATGPRVSLLASAGVFFSLIHLLMASPVSHSCCNLGWCAFAYRASVVSQEREAALGLRVFRDPVVSPELQELMDPR